MDKGSEESPMKKIGDRHDMRLSLAKEMFAKNQKEAAEAWDRLTVFVDTVVAYDHINRQLSGGEWTDGHNALVRLQMQARYDMLAAESDLVRVSQDKGRAGLTTVDEIERVAGKIKGFCRDVLRFESGLKQDIRYIDTLQGMEASLAAIAGAAGNPQKMEEECKSALGRAMLHAQAAEGAKASDTGRLNAIRSECEKLKKALGAGGLSEMMRGIYLKRAVALEAIALDFKGNALGMAGTVKKEETAALPEADEAGQAAGTARKPRRMGWRGIAATVAIAAASIITLFYVFKPDRPQQEIHAKPIETAWSAPQAAPAAVSQEIAALDSAMARSDSILQANAARAQAQADSALQAQAIAKAQANAALAQARADSAGKANAAAAKKVQAESALQARAQAQADSAAQAGAQQQASIKADAAGRILSLAAERGEGVWHLAKKAITGFLGAGAASNANIAKLKNAVLANPGAYGIAQQDILYGHEGGFWLVLGAKASFSQEKVSEALGLKVKAYNVPHAQDGHQQSDIKPEGKGAGDRVQEQSGAQDSAMFCRIVSINGGEMPMLCAGGEVAISAKAGTGIWVVAREIHRLLTGSSGYGAQEQASIRAIAKGIAG
ncbi:MAG: hypothetical protein WC717_04530, partial [Candidatus Micrarchaeia archaeon]